MDSKNFPNLFAALRTVDKEEAEMYTKKDGRVAPPKIGQSNIAPGDNARFLKNALEVNKLPPINTADAEAVEERIQWYFCYCMENDAKPTVTGLALSIGVSRRMLSNWANGTNRAETHKDIVRKAYQIMETLWEDYMLNGKINPIPGIFLGKNQFGYQDKTEVVVTPNNKLGSAGDPEAIRRRYLAESSDSVDYVQSEEDESEGEDTGGIIKID